MKDIVISGAREGNLKNISLQIPREKLVVLTGVSGSGKSTLLIDVLFNECQRQYLEAMDLQGIRKPQVESIRGVSPAVCITQRGANRNPRSTVGTVTNIYINCACCTKSWRYAIVRIAELPFARRTALKPRKSAAEIFLSIWTAVYAANAWIS